MLHKLGMFLVHLGETIDLGHACVVGILDFDRQIVHVAHHFPITHFSIGDVLVPYFPVVHMNRIIIHDNA